MRRSSLLLLILGIVGCHGMRGAQAPTLPAHAPRPLTATLAGSTVALAKVDDRRIAFISDADTQTIRRVDLDTRAELVPIKIPQSPGQLLILDDGRIAVLVAEDSKVMVLGGFRGLEDDGTDRAWLRVATDPMSMTLSPDRKTLYVASGATHTVTAYDAKTLDQKSAMNVAREPRTMVVSDDNKRVYVAHAVGSHFSMLDVTKPKEEARVITLRGEDPRASEPLPSFVEMEQSPKELKKLAERRKKRQKEGLPSCQSFALAKSEAIPGRIFMPAALVDPGEQTEKSEGYGSGGDESETPIVAVIDENVWAPVPASLRRLEPDQRQSACILPRAAVIDDANKALLVACMGINQIVAYDATAAVPEKSELRRWDVGAGPNGVAIDERHNAVAWSQFDRTVSIMPVNGSMRATRIALGAPTKPSVLALGRVLFHSTHDERISSDGRACASCHPDGRDDGLVWSTPEGPRRSISLAGRLEDTAPFSWQGNAGTVQKHLASTFSRLGGAGLEGAELEALVTYVKSLRSPTRPELDDSAADGSNLGAKVFASAKTGCVTCHSGPTFTDGAMHDVGSGRAFNTPSLVGVGSTGPWFHDGRYESLGDLLRASDGKMGRTKHLTKAEFAALETFVGSL